MTDVLTRDDELLSSNEIVPKEAAAPSEPIGKACPDCGKTTTKMGLPFITNAQVATHRMKSHGYKPETGSKAKPKTSARTSQARKPSSPKPSAVSARRKPLGESLARIFLQVGRIINAAVDPPTGAAIMFEAGALGVAIDNVIAGTFVDKPLQKGAGIAEKFEPLVPLVTMPAMVFMLSKNPAASGMLEGELREAVEDILVQSLPLLRKRVARTQATVDALAELKAIDKDLAASNDPIGAILQGFFTTPAEGPTMPEPGTDDVSR